MKLGGRKLGHVRVASKSSVKVLERGKKKNQCECSVVLTC